MKLQGNMRRYLLGLTVLVIIISIGYSVMNYIDNQRVLGVWFFINDLYEAESITVYDRTDAEVATYGQNEIADFVNDYLPSVPIKSYPTYLRNVKKDLGEILYTIEIGFSEDRNNSVDRPAIKNSEVEIMEVYAFKSSSAAEQNVFGKSLLEIDGQDCVAFLRHVLLEFK